MEAINSVLKNSKMKEMDLQCDNNIPVCEKCGEPIGKLVKMAFGIRVYPRACRCVRDRRKKNEIESKNKEKQMRLKQVIKNSMMNDKFKKCTLENWDHNLGNENLYNIAKKYVMKFKEMKKTNQGIVVHGAPGNGKTFFSVCIANALIKRLVPVICVGAIALVERIEESKRKWGDEYGIFTVLNNLKNADLLVIDDLGTEPDNKFSRAMIYQIVESRSNSQLPTIITTNISIEELKNRYDDRTYSRLTEMCSFIRNKDEDIRKIEGQGKTKKFMQMLGA